MRTAIEINGVVIPLDYEINAQEGEVIVLLVGRNVTPERALGAFLFVKAAKGVEVTKEDYPQFIAVAEQMIEGEGVELADLSEIFPDLEV